MARVSHLPDEQRDQKADSLWRNLAAKLGLGGMVRTAAARPDASPLSDAIQTHAAVARRDAALPASDALVSRVADSAKAAERWHARVAGALRTALDYKDDKIGTTEEWAKAMGATDNVGAKLVAAAGSMGKRASDHQTKLGEIRKVVEALGDKAIKDAPSYKTVMDQVWTQLNDYSGMLMPAAPIQQPGIMGPMDSIAPTEPGMVQAQAQGEAENLRLAQAYNHLSLAYSLASFLMAQAGAAAVAPALPQFAAGRGGMLRAASAALRGTMARLAGTGDPGDMEPANLIYKDINRCRDCVWFESDWTHETYRDKCKNCVHAKLGGVVDHFWPRSAQIMTWMPTWQPPQAERKARFQGSLSAAQVVSPDDHDAEVARVVVDEARSGGAALNAERLGAAFFRVFSGAAANHLARIGGRVLAHVADITGIDVMLYASRAKEWGWKGAALAEGEVVVAYPKTLQEHMQERSEPEKSEDRPTDKEASLSQEAKGERQKIRDLRQKLEKEDDPGQIKSLNDAIDALEGRIEKDKESKKKRHDEREERRKKQEEQAKAQQPAAEPAKTAAAKPCCGDDGYCDACDRTAAQCTCAGRFAGTLSLAGAREREQKRPVDYGRARPPKPMKALAAATPNQVYVNQQGLKVQVSADGLQAQVLESPVPDFTVGESVALDQGFEQEFRKELPKPMAKFVGTLCLGRSL